MTVRPLTVCAERDMRATPAALYRAWTSEFDRWFAAAETLAMTAEIGRPFFFEVVHEGERHPHYGRFLRLEPDRLVEITWLTGPKGTKGAETVVTVELAPRGSGTHLRLTQTGFADEESRQAHANGWRHVLGLLDERVPC
jgi:uncharacterized protein YndB with AHSA1/START domain